MSVRKRSWKTTTGEARTAFIADYTIDGRRHHKQFDRGQRTGSAGVRRCFAWGRAIAGNGPEGACFARELARRCRRSRPRISQRGPDSRARRHAREKRHKRRLEIGRDIPAPGEVAALLRAASERWRPFFMVAALCGLQASELRALRWSDVDLRTGYLHIRQRADYRQTIGRPKSFAGERSVPIPPECGKALVAWREDARKARWGWCSPLIAERCRD